MVRITSQISAKQGDECCQDHVRCRQRLAPLFSKVLFSYLVSCIRDKISYIFVIINTLFQPSSVLRIAGRRCGAALHAGATDELVAMNEDSCVCMAIINGS